MKLQVVSGLKRVKNETTSWFQFQTIENEATSCFQLKTSLEWSYKLFSTSNGSGMKLQVVSNFNRVNNKATSCLRAKTSQEWNYKLITISNNRKWSYMLFLTSNESGIQLQVVSNINLVNNKATSCFRAQTSQKWNYKLIPISNNRK